MSELKFIQKIEHIRNVTNLFRHTQVLKDPFANKLFPKTLFGREVITKADLYDAWRDGNLAGLEHCKIEIAKALD